MRPERRRVSRWTSTIRNEAIDGRVVEISRNYFAQARDGTVCYFGEEVDIFDDEGNVTSHSGAWRADDERFLPGIGLIVDGAARLTRYTTP